MTASQTIGKIMYEQAAQAGAQAATAGTAGGETPADASPADESKKDDVIDAEFEVKDKK